MAATATILIAAGLHFSPGLSTCLYLGMGWGVVLCYFQIAQAVSHRALLPVVIGGLSYSAGRVLNLRLAGHCAGNPGLTRSFTSSYSRAAWLTTGSFSRSSHRFAGRLKGRRPGGFILKAHVVAG